MANWLWGIITMIANMTKYILFSVAVSLALVATGFFMGIMYIQWMN
jgi:hypothetical protein